MIDGWKLYKGSKPEFYTDITSTILTFYLTDNDVVENVVEKRLNKIIDLIKQNKYISAKKISEILNITSRTAQRDLQKLREQNKIKRMGGDKGGYWDVL